jgi:TetR/AcrR family transcriptional regulator, transcriptional repressor for nem operon
MNTRDEIVYIADALIRNRGYKAFSYSDIGADMHIRPAAIHYHFHAKSDLGLEVIRQELSRVAVFRRGQAGLPGGDQLKRLFHTFYRQSLEYRLCLIGSLTHDFATFDEPMQDAVKELCSEISNWVADCLEKERKEGRMRFKGKAVTRALLVVSTLLSSLLLGRVMGHEVFIPMADQLLQDLGADWRIDDLPEPPEDYDDPYSYT